MGTRNILIAIGAGSIDYVSDNEAAVTNWLKAGFDTSICVTDDQASAHSRDPVTRTLAGYAASEFSPVRQRLYASAAHNHDVASRDRSASEAGFIRLVQSLGI